MGEICANELQRQILKNQKIQHVIVHKFWLISVFVTNAKGGDFWHCIVFFISDKTYSILNDYRSHHLVYSVYRAFSGYLVGSSLKQFTLSIPKATE